MDSSTIASTTSDEVDGDSNPSSATTTKAPKTKFRDTLQPPPNKNGGGVIGYLSNPTITPTALAHSLWKTVIRPYDDIVIDATCGNGKDAVALCSMLFPEIEEEEDTISASSTSPKLICIDIQKRAC